jgi:uncharacterized protein (DUF2141 family)
MIRPSILGLAIALLHTLAASAADLSVAIEGLRSDRGNVMVAVFDGAASFRKEGQEIAALRLAARAAASRFTLSRLPDGVYAIVAFHDENGNGKLDTNMLGLPTEGYGFSNDARGTFGPPGFDDAKVTLGDAGARITIKVGY